MLPGKVWELYSSRDQVGSLGSLGLPLGIPRIQGVHHVTVLPLLFF